MSGQPSGNSPMERQAYQRQLLRSAALLDRPRPESRQRLRAAILAGGGVSLTATTVAGAATKAAATVVLKAFGVGAILGVVTISTVKVVQTVQEQPGKATPLSQSGQAIQPGIDVSASSTALEKSAEATGSNVGGGEGKPSQSQSMGVPEPRTEERLVAVPVAPSSARGADSRGAVRMELQKIDQARQRLAEGDANGALQEIADYERAHPSGVLGEEALVVRIEALAVRGDVSQAQALGEAFLRAHPSSPYAGRVRAAATNPRSIQILPASSGH